MNATRSQLHGPTDFNGKKALVNWPSVAVYASTETWPSGRRRSPAKGVGEESSRGFESLRLRHLLAPKCFLIKIHFRVKRLHIYAHKC